MTTPDIRGNLHKGTGSPEGGQFTGKGNPRPDGGLTAEEAREAHRTLMGPAKALISSFRIDSSNAEDVAQDAWVDLLKRKTKEGSATTIREIVQDKNLLRLVSRTIANRDYTAGGADGFRHEDFRARRALQEREAAFLAENDRKMTPDERVAAADEIRLSFAAGRRPRADFHVEYKSLSLDVTIGDNRETFGDMLGESLAVDDVPGFDDQEDAAAGALHDMENGSAAKTDVRRDVWRIVSIRNGAPQVVPARLTAKDAKNHRKVIEEAGGARALAQKWLDGRTTEAEDAALFAPFGDLGVDDREKAAEVLDDHPGFADQLWGEALRVASRR